MTRPISRPPEVDNFGVTGDEYASLCAEFTQPDHWLKPPDVVRSEFLRFKRAIKDYFFYQQRRKCCYCCIELSFDHASFTLDHVIARTIAGQFILAVNNMGVCCRPCNTKKSNFRAVSPEIDVSAMRLVPRNSADYVIVHPQLDCWDTNMAFDLIGRIVPVTEKGGKTIEACGIERLNALRVADYFSVHQSASVYRAVLNIMRFKQSARRKAAANLLKEAAQLSGSSRAAAMADQISAEFE